MPRSPRFPLVGAHVSTAGGLAAAAARAAKLGADAVQIFPANPRQWESAAPSEQEVRAFGEALRRRGTPLFLHTIYLVNLASPDAGLRHKSAAALAGALRFGALAGARAVVTHVGSHRGDGFSAGTRRVAETVSGIFAAEPMPETSPALLLEVSAGSGQSLGSTPGEIGALLSALSAQGVAAGVCLDTAHLFAAGFPIHEPAGLGAYLDALAREAGPGTVGLVHLNDSRSKLGSKADRHENLGEGEIGRQGLAGWLRHPLLSAVPFVLEVPGFDGKGPDRRNLRRAKLLRDQERHPET